MADRRYDEKEVGKILQKAAEYQSGSAQAGNAEGLTLAELQKVAGEVGIDPAIVERAAGEIDLSPKSRARNKSDSTLIDKTIEGELSDEGWEDLVTELRRFVGRPGTTETTGKSREWIGAWDIGYVMLTATSRGGKTRLKLMGDTSGATALAWTLGISFGFIATLISVVVASKTHSGMGVPLTTLLGATVAGTIAALTSWIIRSYRRKFGVLIEGLLERLSKLAEESSLESKPEQPSMRDSLASPVSEVDDFEPDPIQQPNRQ